MTCPEDRSKTSTSPPETHLKAHEIAPYFNVSRRTWLNWHADGLVPASIAIGRVLRFDLKECREALKEHARN